MREPFALPSESDARASGANAAARSADVLSDVLRSVRLTGAVYFDFELSSPWVAEAPPSREIAVIRGGADATDGLEISSAPLGPGLPHGIMVAMNSEAKNFLVFRWQDVAPAVQPPLRSRGALGDP